LFGSAEKIFLEKLHYILNNEVTSKYLSEVECLGKDRQMRGGEKGGREKAQPSKKKDREMKRKQVKLDRLQRQKNRS
jgi:hypothetical protein